MQILIFIYLLIFAFPTTANCAGFIGPGSMKTVYRAIDVLKADDDSPCVLEGHIIAKIRGRKNRYLFEDDSGQVVVEIKKKVFGSNTVIPANLVRLEGEVEVDDKYPNEMETENLTILR